MNGIKKNKLMNNWRSALLRRIGCNYTRYVKAKILNNVFNFADKVHINGIYVQESVFHRIENFALENVLCKWAKIFCELCMMMLISLTQVKLNKF